MNPFANATLMGYSPDEVITFLRNFSPKMADKIQKALALGYSAQEITDFLGRGFDASDNRKKKAGPDYESALRIMGERKPEAVKQSRAEREQREQDVLSETLSAAVPTAAGAGIGFATGGPVGAAAGAAGAFEGITDLLNQYEKHRNEGGSLGLKDFLKSMLKAGGTAATVSQAPRLLAALQAGGLLGSEEEPQPQDLQEVQAAVSQPAPAPETQQVGPQESYEFLKAQGLGPLFDGIAREVQSGDEVFSAMSRLYGRNRMRELASQSKRNVRDIFNEAFEYFKASAPQRGESTAPLQGMIATPKQGKQTPIPPSEVGQQLPEGIATPQQDLQPMPQAQQIQEPAPSYLDRLFKPTEAKARITEKVQPFKGLKSSNVRGATYNADTQKMRLVFKAAPGRKGGQVYEYDNVDFDTFQKMTGGQAKPITEGENEYGVWYHQKNPSIGAAFDKFVKKQSDNFPFTKQDPTAYRLDEKQIIEADRTFQASDLFEPFKQQRTRGRQVKKGQILRELEPALKAMDDDFIGDIVNYLESKLGLKNPPKVSRLQKEFRKEFL